MRKPRRMAAAGLLIAAAFFAAGGTALAQDFSKYHNYAEMTTIVQGLAGANKTLVKLETLGKSLGKRDLWMLQIANPAGVPVGERPGVLIAANFEGDHIYGSELALFIADFLVKGYGSNANVKQRLDNFVYLHRPPGQSGRRRAHVGPSQGCPADERPPLRRRQRRPGG